jgi:hypothetical protein
VLAAAAAAASEAAAGGFAGGAPLLSERKKLRKDDDAGVLRAVLRSVAVSCFDGALGVWKRGVEKDAGCFDLGVPLLLS